MPAPPSLALRIQIVFLEAASVEKVKILNFCNPPARKTGGFFVADLPSNNKKQGRVCQTLFGSGMRNVAAEPLEKIKRACGWMKQAAITPE